uniref:Uncharacterized protein n=1 Tax=Tanacetum cinerariifolium TaxID=118510 RepID=A0A6L2LH62_TANCI|nr:hypothetical protein [Tanacetum cinerariifolium]
MITRSSSSSSSDSEVSTCSKAYLKSYETLKEHYDNLSKDYKKSQFNVGAYKTGLESVEARLVVYKKNEEIFEDNIKILKLDIHLRDNALTELRKKFKKVKKERDDLKLTLEKFENSSKNLSKLLDRQICDKFKTGVGFDSQEFDNQADYNYHQRERVEYGNNYTRGNYNYSTKKAHPSAHKNMAPRPVLMKTGLRPLNTTMPVNTAHPKTTLYSARPMSHFSKSAKSTIKRPKSVNTARPNSAVVNAVKANQVHVVKALACWVWRPTKLNSASITLKKHNYVDARGRSKNLMEDMLPLGEELKDEKLLIKELLKLNASNDEAQPYSDAGKKDDDSGPFVQGKGSTHLVESYHTPTSASSTLQPPVSPTSKRTTRQESMVPQPKSPTQSFIADEAASTGVDVRYGRDTTTVTGLEARQGSGNIDKTLTIPHDSPLLRVNTIGSDEGSMTQQELMVFCTTLSKKVESLEIDVKQTKQIYEIQGRYGHDMKFDYDFDTAEKDVSTAKPVSTGGAAVTTDSVVVSTPSPIRNTRVYTADDITMAKTLVYIRKSVAKDKGKGKITESEMLQTKTKLQQEQERLGFEAAMRLQAKLDEEESQRIARVHELACSFNVEEWEDILLV